MVTKHVALNRQYDLDWIRVIATIFVFLYHCSMFFNPFPWHVKNNELDSGSILSFSLFVGAWMMPIFFVVSGMSVIHALKKRTKTVYIKERLMRLGIPLMFGVFVLTPPQIYLERLANNQFNGSFFAFLPHFFDGVYLDFGGTGNFAFFGLHLWYLLVLIVFSFLTLPLFNKISSSPKYGKKHFIILPFLLFLIGPINTQALGGWDLLFYLVVFIYGYYFFSSNAFKPALKSTIMLHIILALLTSVAYIVWFIKASPEPGSIEGILFYAVRIVNCWSLLLCIFYFADKYLSFSNRFLKYGSEASMPFYVLHQPIIVFLAFLIRDISWSIPIKLLFLVTISFTIIIVSYHFIVRRFNVLRILFGLKAKKRESTVSTPNSIHA